MRLGLLTLGLALALAAAPARAAQAPVVDRFAASTSSVLPGGLLSLDVQAHDPDCAGTCTTGCGSYVRADLTAWTASGGSIVARRNGTSGSPYAAGADWQAPTAEGSYTVSVTLADSGTSMCGGRQTKAATLTVQVTSSTNRPPAIDSLGGTPGQLYPGQSAQLECRASDPDADAISYAWSADAGIVAATGAGTATFVGTAPGAPSVTCTASDGLGGMATASFRFSLSDAVAEARIEGLHAPQRIAVDSWGDAYVVDRPSGGLAVVSLATGGLLYRIPAPAATAVAIDWQDRLLIGEERGARLADRSGRTLLRFEPGEDLGAVADVAVDPARRRYAALHAATGRVVVYDEAGARMTAFGATADGPDGFLRPQGLAFQPDGGIVVADSGHATVKTFSASGAPLLHFGGRGAGAGRFVALDDVATDERGVIYASDPYQSWVQTFNPDGSVREVLGTYGEGVGRFRTPTGIAPVTALRRVAIASLNSSTLEVYRMSDAPPLDRRGSASLSPQSLGYAPQAVGTESAAQAVVVTNVGSAPVGIGAVAASGEFSPSHDCGRFLDPGQSCAVRVTFRPERAGPQAGELRLLASDSAQPHLVALQGIALAPAQAALTPEQLVFGPQSVGAAGPSRTLSLSNAGAAPLGVGEVVPSAGFLAAHSCPASLAPGASCLIAVSFAPESAGEVAGQLVVQTSAGPLTAALSGLALAPSLALSPTTIDFADASARERRTIEVANLGVARVRIDRVGLDGSGASAYRLDDHCSGETLAPGGSCRIQVRLRSRAPGAYDARLLVDSDAPDSPHAAWLSASLRNRPGLVFKDGFESGDLSRWPEVFPPVLRLTRWPASSPTLSLAFGSRRVGSSSAAIPLRIVNGGSEERELGAVRVEAPGEPAFELATDGCSGRRLEAGRACTIEILFEPAAAEAATAEISVASREGETLGRARLAGTGVRDKEPR